jgi:hypothetical protein
MPYIAIIIFVLLIIGLAFAFYAGKIQKKAFEKTGKHPKGHYMGIGIAMGLPLGIPLGLAMDNIAIGPALGVAIGVAIGSALEKKHEKELRPLTKEELELKRKTVIALGGLSLFGIIAFILTYFLMK